MPSAPGKLSVDDWQKVVRGLLYTVAGTVAAYLATQAQMIDQTDTRGLLIVIVVSGISNLLTRWVSDNNK